jgi:hypothetical protein
MNASPFRTGAILAAFLTWAGAAQAQIPDLQVKLDVNLHYRSALNEPTTVRFYDSLARPSTVALIFMLEPGFRAYVSERFQRIPNDGDPEQLEQYYLEDPGIWRVGKQVLPFGKENLMRMTAKGARGETTLAFRYIPIVAAVCDDGEGLTRGIVGRLGSRLGVSFAVGRNIGIQSTCLAALRGPEGGLGKGHGFQQAYGVDYTRRFGAWGVQAEYVTLRRGETVGDVDRDVSDVLFTLEPSKYQKVTIGWSRDWRDTLDMYRIEGHFWATRNVWIEPMVRYRNGNFFDFGVSLRVKL